MRIAAIATDISTAASLHFLCAIENALVMEYCVEPSEISQREASGQHQGQLCYLPEEPGLGVEPNQEIIEKYLVRT